MSDENPVREIDVFVDELDLGALGFEGVEPAVTGRPSYHPGLMLKLGDRSRLAHSSSLISEPKKAVG